MMAFDGRKQFDERVGALGGWCWWSDTESAAGPFESIEVRRIATGLINATRQGRRPSSTVDLSRHRLVGLLDFGSASVVVAVALADGDRLVPVVENYFRDLRKASEYERAAAEFAERLSQSFEEVNLIFRMAQTLHSADDPHGVMRTMCGELRDVLPFAWFAIRFVDGPAVLPDLRGRLIVAGTAPAESLDRHTGRMCRETGGPVIRGPVDCELAAATGQEILVQPVLHEGEAIGLIVAGNKTTTDPDVSSNETQLVSAAAGFLGLFHENASRFAKQRALFLGTLQALTAAVDAKDPYTRGHSDRVGWLASEMATALGLTPSQVETYRIAGLLHDVGKIGVPEAVLRKPARLTDEEFGQIKLHPETGYRILKDIEALADICPGVLSHHERWDGRGYPHGLAGGAIPLVARVLALSDSFDAMSSSRAYRTGMPRPQVLAEIGRSAGTQFDPDLVPHFLALDFSGFDRMLDGSLPQARAA